MRTSNSIKNITVTIIGQAIRVLFNFLMRIVFIKYLSNNYLGLDGLFSNILVVLSLAELGIGQAITFSLYEPLKNNDVEKLKSLMNLYKKAYISIGLIILIVGLTINPFLPFFINGNTDIPENLNILYSLYVISVASSYFSSYKRELINADQKMYITNFYILICLILMNIIQIIALIISQKFSYYLIIKILFTWVENILINIKANKMYQFLKEKDIKPLDKITKANIKKNIFGAVFYKSGKICVNSTDNIILSKFIGLTSVGLYSNYRLVINSVTTILTQMISSITPSVGNLGKNDKNKLFSIFNKTYFATFWIYSISTICFYFLINNFIILWLGEKYLLNNFIIILISINFFLNGINTIISVYRDAFGLYWKGKLKPLLEVLINLIFSLLLVEKYGIFGVLLGTLISNLAVNIWFEVYILYKDIFNKNIIDYFKMMIKYILILCINITIVYITVLKINISNILLSFILKIFIVFIESNLLYLIIFRKKEEFIYFKKLFYKYIYKIIKRKKELK